MTPGRRVVVTGMGSVSAAGVGGTAVVAESLDRRPRTIAPLRAFDVEGCTSRLAAEVEEERFMPLLDAESVRRLSRICRMALAACRVAVDEAGLAGGERLGLVVGSEHGDFRSGAEFFGGFLSRGPAGLSPMVFPSTVMNSMAAVATIALGARAASVTLNQATVAGDLAVARGAALIASGRAETVIAGGVDELFREVYLSLARMRALSPMDGGPEDCRPYEADHNGPVLGEGATFLVLEEREAARARGAAIIAELLGAAWGAILTAPHTAHPGRRDARGVVRRALAQAGVEAGSLARCYGSGNGDPALDDWELRLLEADGVRRPESLAPLFGQHGGLGALRVAAAALDARAGRAPALVHGIARGGCRTALVVGHAA